MPIQRIIYMPDITRGVRYAARVSLTEGPILRQRVLISEMHGFNDMYNKKV